jgi:hypothetical protein
MEYYVVTKYIFLWKCQWWENIYDIKWAKGKSEL